MTDELKSALISFKSSILGRDIRSAMYRAFTLVDEERNKDEGSIYKYLLFRDRIAKEYAKMVAGMEAVLPDDLKAAVHEQEWYGQLMETIAENDIDVAVSDALQSLSVSVPDYLPDSDYIQPLLDGLNSLHKVWNTTHEWHSVGAYGTMVRNAFTDRYGVHDLVAYYIGDASEVTINFNKDSNPAICITTDPLEATPNNPYEYTQSLPDKGAEYFMIDGQLNVPNPMVAECMYCGSNIYGDHYPGSNLTITINKDTLDAGNIAYLLLGQDGAPANHPGAFSIMHATITITHDNFIKRGGA